MPEAQHPPRDLAEWMERLRDVEPALLFVPRLTLRRIIRRHNELPLSGFQTPHEHYYWIDAADLRALPPIPGLDMTRVPPTRVLLMPRPEPEEFARHGPRRMLVEGWRWLFRAAVERDVQLRLTDVKPAVIWNDFDAASRNEIHQVLETEDVLLHPGDEREAFAEFVALWSQQKYFHPDRLAIFFPGLSSPDAVIRIFRGLTDLDSLYQKTRPAASPSPSVLSEEDLSAPEARLPTRPVAELQDTAEIRAIETGRRGNDVRAAILLRRAGRMADAEKQLDRLIARLCSALHLGAPKPAEWLSALRPLLEPAAEGVWPPAGRLLYELQKACIDVERKVYSSNLLEWVATLGRKPIKRLLDKPSKVNILRRLKAAGRLADKAILTTQQRQKLQHVLDQAVHSVEAGIRTEFRPILLGVLEEVGLHPANQVERVARDKIVEELLDVICARGFLLMGDVRDALSRNQLKLPDVESFKDLAHGDGVIRTNRLLAKRLDGVYRRGEIYLRMMQAFSALAFGTPLGRFITRYIALPFGGSFIVLKGVEHFVHIIWGWITHRTAVITAVSEVTGSPAFAVLQHPPATLLTNLSTIISLGVFLLLIINVPSFRRKALTSVYLLFWHIPRTIIHSPVVCYLFDNRITCFIRRYLVTPALVGSLAGIIVYLYGMDGESSVGTGLIVCLLSGILFRSPFGQGIEEQINDVLAHLWQVISVNFVVGLITLIWQIFHTIFETIERSIYTVDEALRFREGDSRVTFLFKLIFGVFWHCFSYIFRFAWSLLVEPQINPIKHFPVVTVSHKLLIPLIPDLAKTFDVSQEIVFGVVAGIPGIFGFLTWELKENWKLFRANRAPKLGSVAVGSHGENIRRLLRPGLHSGVAPKLYTKLRHAENLGNTRKAARLMHNLGHVVEAVQTFFERELIERLRSSKRWAGLSLHISHITIATNRLRAQLAVQSWAEPLIVEIDERNGWLIAGVIKPGWLEHLSSAQTAAFADALTGLYKFSGVDIVREQAALILGGTGWHIDCTADGPVLDRRKLTDTSNLLFTEAPLMWADWVDRWEQDSDGKLSQSPLIEQSVLPGGTKRDA